MRYTAEDITVLKEIEHVQLNPSMYIGNTENPVHLIEECFDNSLDEALAGHASIIAVIINRKTNVFKILDNGRGIPIDNDSPITISTKLFSGAKFQGKKTAYEISSGMHGVGLVAVNALSDEMSIEIYRDNKHVIYSFKDSKFINKEEMEFSGNRPFSTKIEFKPSEKYFENLEPDIKRLEKRIEVASAEMPDKTFGLELEDEKKRRVYKLNIEDYFKIVTDTKPKELISDIITIESKSDPEVFSLKFFYSFQNTNTKTFSSINLLPVKDGGTHINYVTDIIKNYFQIKAKKYNKKFQPNDCLCGLRAFFILKLKEPKLSGQTKDKLVNRKKYFEEFKNLKSLIEKSIPENLLQDLLEKFEIYRKILDTKKINNGQSIKRRASTRFTKLRDCELRNGELFIVEGDSAGGGLIKARDPKIHAILPLKGKIPNVINRKNILQHTEIGDLIQSLGCGIEPKFNIENLRYKKIITAADADPDGGHIACLVTILFMMLFPELIRQGFYYIAKTPLYAINERDNFVPLWTKEEFDKAVSEKRKIIRFKGLGEMSHTQIKKTLIDKKTRNLIKINMPEDEEYYKKLFSGAEEKRNLFDKERN